MSALVTCHPYLNNRGARRKAYLVPWFVDWFSSAEKHPCEEPDFERVMAHLAKNGWPPWGANHATNSLLNYTNENIERIYRRAVSFGPYPRPKLRSLPNLL